MTSSVSSQYETVYKACMDVALSICSAYINSACELYHGPDKYTFALGIDTSNIFLAGVSLLGTSIYKDIILLCVSHVNDVSMSQSIFMRCLLPLESI